ncbi:hypothetical protein GCM10010116_36470 [Microbispora rosea subsp. aerata]|nr:hypothetical protein GCM10010116_36470 [Microbispora rosea subsp. aerata]GIH56717.1 hypothetical protein Mro02_36310 [Microbispora rosea subsp. aerata]GLJ82090.1 hypothetical protein GCM10017588_08150 [Microbispora rosea subsp. aerata]
MHFFPRCHYVHTLGAIADGPQADPYGEGRLPTRVLDGAMTGTFPYCGKRAVQRGSRRYGVPRAEGRARPGSAPEIFTGTPPDETLFARPHNRLLGVRACG